MPIRDHFHPPFDDRLPWPSLHNGWIGTITERLNELLPPEFQALDSMRLSSGHEIDIATVEREDGEHGTGRSSRNGGGTAVATAPTVYTAPPALGTTPFTIADASEIKVFTNRGSRHLVAAIELVSPANKDREEHRTAFVGKCLSYLGSAVSVVIVDTVTERHANLHNELIEAIKAPDELRLPETAFLYAAAYRPVIRKKKTALDVWVNAFSVGDALPTMPLRLVGDLFVPVELEATYTEACRRRRLV